MKKWVFFLLSIVVPLCGGLLIYLLLSPSAIVSKLFYNTFSLNPPVISISDSIFWMFIRFHLCDLLWAYSFSASCFLVFDRSSHQFLLAIPISVLFCIIIEFCQKTPLFPGTFDVYDIVLELLGVVLFSLSLVFFHRKEKQNEK